MSYASAPSAPPTAGAPSPAPASPVPLRCPVCGRTLGQLVAGAALVRHHKRLMIAVAVACDRPRCTGVWLAPGHSGTIARVRSALRRGVQPLVSTPANG